eukprot:scaffold129979_cov51-Phaeocystis_antarctica.AAC.1
MFLFETLGGWSEPVVRLFRRMKDKVRNKLTKRQDEHEVTELVDVDVARAAGTTPLCGAAHSVGVGDRDRDAARWGWGRGSSEFRVYSSLGRAFLYLSIYLSNTANRPR